MSSIWKKSDLSIEKINSFAKNTLSETLRIEFTEIGDDYLVAEMPVTPVVHQPAGILHGGASVALAETIGSLGGFLCLSDPKQTVVGLSISSSHTHGVSKGKVIGTGRPIHIGRSTHVWDIQIISESGKLISSSRLTLMVLS